MKRSLVLLPNWIGDMLLALSIIMKLPESRRSDMTLLVPKSMTGLVKLLTGMPQIEYARADESEKKRTLSAVRAGSFNTIYLLPYSFSSALFAMRTGIPVRRGLAREMRGFLLTQRLSGRLRDKTQHITREYAEILDTSFSSPEAWNGVMVTPDKRYAGSVVYCPGAAFGPAKKWRHFPELAAMQGNYHIVVLGTNDDGESAREIVSKAPGRVTDLTGKTTLTEAAAIMVAARAVVSNDSGLMHLAGYLCVPVVGLFGSTSPAWTRPLGKKSITIQSTEFCAPCFRHTCRYNHYRCLENITPKEVLKELEKICSL
jgi:heptosyltransferase II